MINEIWKPIREFEGLYEVSNFGEVKSLPRNGTILKPRLLIGFIDSSGYQQVLLTSKRFHKKIHRLVAEALIPNPDNKPCVNHIDRIKTNNHVDNLEWCTYKENTIHSFKTGRRLNQHDKRTRFDIESLKSDSNFKF